MLKGILLFLTDSLKRTRLFLLVLLIVGIYGLSKTQFLSGKDLFSDSGLFPHFKKMYLFTYLLLTQCLHGMEPVFFKFIINLIYLFYFTVNSAEILQCLFKFGLYT